MWALGKITVTATVLALGLVSVGVAQEKMVDGIPASPPPIGDPAQGAALYENCTPCHGLQGTGIAGKSEAALMAAMQHFQTGTFSAAKVQKMQGILRGLSQEQLADLARYISKM